MLCIFGGILELTVLAGCAKLYSSWRKRNDSGSQVHLLPPLSGPQVRSGQESTQLRTEE